MTTLTVINHCRYEIHENIGYPRVDRLAYMYGLDQLPLALDRYSNSALRVAFRYILGMSVPRGSTRDDIIKQLVEWATNAAEDIFSIEW